MSDIFDHELDAFDSFMDTFEDSPIDVLGYDEDPLTLAWMQGVFDNIGDSK
jgi:hypothetical protein